MKKIELVIFDLAGTIVSFGCLEVFNAFKKLCKLKKIKVEDDIIKQYTGIDKKTHLQLILENPNCVRLTKKSKNYTLDHLYLCFVDILKEEIENNSNMIDGLLETQSFLQTNNIKIATNTGYPSWANDIVLDKLKNNNFIPDYSVCVGDVLYGRPYPYMIFSIMENLEIQSVNNVMVVGDTVADIEAAMNAGVLSVGVVDSSSIIGLDEGEFYNLSDNDKNQLIYKCKILKEAGAKYLIPTIKYLPDTIRTEFLTQTFR